MIVIPVIISMLRGMQDQLGPVASVLTEAPALSAQVTHLLELPANIVKANFEHQPSGVRETVDRIIEATISGRFNYVEAPHLDRK